MTPARTTALRARLAAWPAGALATLAAAALLLPSIGLYPLFDVDEGAFSEATREMLASGDWLSTTLNGAPRFDKPILIYWLQAACVAVLGRNEFALRLPSALAGLAWVLLIARFAAPRWGREIANTAAWIAASSLGVFAMSRAATADALLNALIAAALFDLWRHLESGNRPALLRCYLWIGLGVLAKGPIALLIPCAVSLAYCVSARRWRDWLHAAFCLPGWLILLAVAGPWYGAQLAIHGQDFIDGFLVRHNLDRFHGTLEGHGGGLWYYLVCLPLLLVPWSGMLWSALRRVPRDWGDPLARFLVLWFAFVLAFFSLSGTKLPHYLLYGMTPVFLLLARRVPDAGNARRLTWLPCGVLLLLPLAPAAVHAWSTRAPAGGSAAFFAAQAQRALEAAGPGYYVLTAACALGALALAGARRLPPAERGAGAAALLGAALAFAFLPWLGEVLSGPVKHAGLLAAHRPEAAVQWNFTAPSFSVYRNGVTPAREPQSGELAITRSDRLAPDAPVEILLREGGVVLVRKR